jgi:class 3 adenylate cyclase/cytoskeletal protein RodZ
MDDHASEALRSEREVGHVLFMDIVGYSKLFNDKQPEVLQRFKDIVRASAEVARAQSAKGLISPWSGDGMALVFFGDQEAAARASLEISRALLSYPHIKLRMGVHSGPVERIEDFNNIENAAGKGINMAQRVMDCGDAGHILVSKRVADDLASYAYWQPLLHDLGEVTVKHGERVHIFNLYTDELGNPELPEKLKKRKMPSASIFVLAIILLIAAIGSALVVRALRRQNETNPKNNNAQFNITTPAPERAFTYFLTPSEKGKSIEEERFTGNEQFHNGSKFRLVFMPEQSGALYLLDLGAGANQTEAWNVLFPTPKNHGGSSQVAANQRMEAQIDFDRYPGSETVFVIWSTQPIPDLEAIFKGASNTNFEIKDSAQIATVKKFLENHSSPEPTAEVNTDKIQTTVRSNGEIFIRKFVLKHLEF